MPKYEVYESKTKMKLYLLLIIFINALFTIPIFMFIKDSSSMDFFTFLLFLSIFLLLFFVILIFLKRIKNNNPLLVFESEHLILYQKPTQPIRFEWVDIDAFYPYVLNKQKFLGIILKNEEEYINALPSNTKKWANINLRTGFPAFNISFTFIKNSDEVTEKIASLGIPFVTPK